MVRVCPQPKVWNDIQNQLLKHARRNHCTPREPPIPLILGRWVYSSDVEKKRRWEETIDWAGKNGCAELVSNVANEDFYCVEIPPDGDH
jgi:hypothetical protein